MIFNQAPVALWFLSGLTNFEQCVTLVLATSGNGGWYDAVHQSSTGLSDMMQNNWTMC